MIAASHPALDVRAQPIETQPLAHFLPGSSVLQIGAPTLSALTHGGCSSSDVMGAARRLRCSSVAASIDIAASIGMTDGAFVATAEAAHDAGLRWIALADASSPAHPDALRQADAVIVETSDGRPHWVEEFVERDDVWVEIVAMLSAEWNDDDASIHDLSSWVLGHLGPELPLHFAPRADAPVPAASLRRARSIGLGDGLHFVYTSPLADHSAGITLCPRCGEHVIERDGPAVTAYRLTSSGRCHACGIGVAGRFDGGPSGRMAAVLLSGDDR